MKIERYGGWMGWPKLAGCADGRVAITIGWWIIWLGRSKKPTTSSNETEWSRKFWVEGE